MYLNFQVHENKEKTEKLSQRRGDSRDIMTKFKAEPWIGSWDGKGTLMETLVKFT